MNFLCKLSVSGYELCFQPSNFFHWENEVKENLLNWEFYTFLYISIQNFVNIEKGEKNPQGQKTKKRKHFLLLSCDIILCTVQCTLLRVFAPHIIHDCT